MLRRDLLELIAASGLPSELRACLARAAAARTPSVVKTELRRDPAGYLARVGRLLAAAAAELGLPPGEVCFTTGFCACDLAPERFDAMLAELEAALWLAGRGYTGLQLQAAGAARGADISACRNGNRYFFEVRRLRPEAVLPADTGRLKKLVEKKLRQVRTSCKKTGALCGGVLLVTGAKPIKVTGYLIQDSKLLEL